jgi:hypothetical protein
LSLGHFSGVGQFYHASTDSLSSFNPDDYREASMMLASAEDLSEKYENRRNEAAVAIQSQVRRFASKKTVGSMRESAENAPTSNFRPASVPKRPYVALLIFCCSGLVG